MEPEEGVTISLELGWLWHHFSVPQRFLVRRKLPRVVSEGISYLVFLFKNICGAALYL